MKSLAIILTGVTICLYMYSCSSRDLNDLEPIEQGIVEDFVTFNDVRFVFENICTQCHTNPPQNGAPMPLITYDNVKNAVETRGLLNRISRQEGESGLMPFGGPRLPQATIDLIFEWNDDGLLEN